MGCQNGPDLRAGEDRMIHFCRLRLRACQSQAWTRFKRMAGLGVCHLEAAEPEGTTYDGRMTSQSAVTHDCRQPGMKNTSFRHGM